MRKWIYISADYSINDGDREVIDVLHRWGKDDYHKVSYIDTAQVASGSVANNPDCRPCELKREFNEQINASSAVIFIIGDKTSLRTAGSGCERYKKDWIECKCTPYKQNANGVKTCKACYTEDSGEDVGSINPLSYLQHEFEQAKLRNKKIIVVYNSLIKMPAWLPLYMKEYEGIAEPFWIRDTWGLKTGNYEFVKKALGYE